MYADLHFYADMVFFNEYFRHLTFHCKINIWPMVFFLNKQASVCQLLKNNTNRIKTKAYFSIGEIWSGSMLAELYIMTYIISAIRNPVYRYYFSSYRHSILAVTNLLAHNNNREISYCSQISLQSAAVNNSFSDNLTPLGVTFILLAMVHHKTIFLS